MSALFYTSLYRHSTFHQYCACVMINPCQKSVRAFIDNLTFGCDFAFVSVSFSNCHFCMTLLSRMLLSRFKLLPSLDIIIISVVFMLSWLCNFFSPSFAYCKCHSHFSLYIVNVVFWHGKWRLSCKAEFGLFQRVNLVLMSPSSH